MEKSPHLFPSAYVAGPLYLPLFVPLRVLFAMVSMSFVIFFVARLAHLV